LYGILAFRILVWAFPESFTVSWSYIALTVNFPLLPPPPFHNILFIIYWEYQYLLPKFHPSLC
jgi:hypothetical protein